jgi:SAM-dependent methyltransferase
MSASPDPEELRAAMRARWEDAAPGWGKRADELRTMAMPVASWMIDHLELQPGQRVLELAAGPGDVGFLAAELIKPGGTLICSDGADAMLAVARDRAARLGIENVEFRRLELEWIDLPAADVDAVLCRWGIMLSLDPGAALRECRRVLRPGGRMTVAVWDDPALNPWGTIPLAALVKLGYAPRPDPQAPGPFALSAPGRLEDLLADAGFVDVVVERLGVGRTGESLEAFLGQTLDISRVFADTFTGLSEPEQASVVAEMRALAEPFTSADGSVRLPGQTLVAVAEA